jgi:hypothetical protein
MRILFLFLVITTILNCKAQKSNQSLSEEEYSVVNAVLDSYSLNRFLLVDEDYTRNLNFALGAYENWKKEFLKNGRVGGHVSKEMEWILNDDDVKFISQNIKSDTIRIKWDKNKMNPSEILYASKHPELVTSTEVPRLGIIHISKPYLNKDKTKAVVVIITGGGYLVLVKKTDEGWKVCGKILFQYS